MKNFKIVAENNQIKIVFDKEGFYFVRTHRFTKQKKLEKHISTMVDIIYHIVNADSSALQLYINVRNLLFANKFKLEFHKKS